MKWQKRNIELNNFSNVVTLLLAGCGGGSRFVSLKRDKGGLIDKATEMIDNGHDGQRYRVPLMTLDDILKKYNLSSEELVLKMDCEGCEYEVYILLLNVHFKNLVTSR